MKRKLLALLLCLAVLLLAGCQKKETQKFSYGGNLAGEPGGAPTNQPTNPPPAEPQNIPEPIAEPDGNDDGGIIDFDNGDYDPAKEEGFGNEDLAGIFDAQQATNPPTFAPTVHSQYAGATPVRIDPIDMPTATAVPPLNFSYTTYTATNIGLTFEGPVGWTVDESVSDAYIIYNPDPSMDYMATMTIRAEHVTSEYGESDLVKAAKDMLSNINASGLANWKPSNTAPRTLLGYPGVYANYTGTLNGVEVAGRVHVTYASNTLYSIHITYPRAYTDTYKDNVYDKARNTLKQIGQ